jgi:hypothetical protein
MKQLSYTKFENEILPDFRQKLNMAESTEDVKKFFFQTIRGLFVKIFGETVTIRFEDIALKPDAATQYTISDRVSAAKEFKSVWKDSDLPNVMDRLAKAAINRHKRLGRNPEKTASRARM